MDSSLSPVVAVVALQFMLHALSWTLGAWFLRSERAVLIQWVAFLGFIGLGFLLMTQRDDDRTWWAFNGAALCWTFGLIVLWRGLARYFGARERDAWQFGLGLAALVGQAWLGPGVEDAPLRVMLAYGANMVVVGVMLVNLYPAMLDRIGLRGAAIVATPAVAVMIAFGALAGRQFADPHHALELHRFDPGNLRSMYVYITAAALFNFTFMAMVVARLLDRLRTLGERDALTGLYNRRAMVDRLEAQWAAWQRQGQFFAVALVDLDHFKRVNDTHGHAIGDQVLVRAAQRLAERVRSDDLVARMGGEEFVVVLPRQGLSDAVALGERLRDGLRAPGTESEATVPTVTASIGVAQVDRKDLSAEDVLRRADAALYRAKAAGRDRVEADAA